ncbi:asparaginase domain-containing protein [Sphingomonas colocasiae]|uniref:Asparaginase n=1 Tax=Sphingomonas colocasiae TaxID=1848973 RepID=A0ABS7PUB0_9SPHN|nr:asparaginase domain-containing protein [Sphingomonas colocasiae]MBY8824945.1 asparaginase [Sphingomonas colocasiae]
MNDRGPITILTTGGTIDKDYFDALSAYHITGSAAPALLAAARVTHPFEIVEVARKDSLDLTDEDRNRLRDAVARARGDRVVITHGTDTMAATARHLAPAAGKTIVLAGAWSPARFAESDAPFNLGMAFACCQTAPPGIYIAMNGTVFRGDEAVKDRDRGSFVPIPAHGG